MNANTASSIDLHDEIASAVIHGAGTIAALLGGTALITLTAMHGDGLQLAASIVFSVSLLLLYIASTLYHAIQHPVAKTRLQILDHCAIYLLIAGTYTPFTLIALRNSWGWALFSAIWTMALAGVIFKLFLTGRLRRLSTTLYIMMGWLILVAIEPLLRSLDTWSLGWLLAGGVSYTLGTYFYQRDTVRYFHAIWHLFVLAGSICHFVAVTGQVLPK